LIGFSLEYKIGAGESVCVCAGREGKLTSVLFATCSVSSIPGSNTGKMCFSRYDFGVSFPVENICNLSN